MRKLVLSLFLISIVHAAISQRNLQCDICLGSNCSAPFTLVCGTTYTFSTSTTTNAVYAWSVMGGLNIVGPRNQSTVQVEATTGGPAKICLMKSVDGQPPCCTCADVVVDCGTQTCPKLSGYYIVNPVNSAGYWCSDYAGNYLHIDWIGPNTGTTTITFRDPVTMNIIPPQYTGIGGGDVWYGTAGVGIGNHIPPLVGTYLMSIVNECNPDDLVGGFVEVVQCDFAKKSLAAPASDIRMTVYPNPVTSDNLTIKLSDVPAEFQKNNGKIVLRLVDPIGTTNVKPWIFNATSEQISFSTAGIRKGTYFLVATIGAKNVSAKVIIK